MIKHGVYSAFLLCFFLGMRGMAAQASSADTTVQSQRALTWQQLGEYYFSKSKKDSAIQYLSQAIETYQQLGEESRKANAQYTLALIYLNADNYARALSQAQLSYEFYRQSDEVANQASVASLLCDIYKYLGRNDLAIEYCIEALRLWDELPRDTERVYVLNSIGTIYFNLNTYDKALQYFEEALALARKNKEAQGIATSLSNMGDVALKTGDTDKALAYFYQAFRLDSARQDQWGLSYSHYNVGKVYFELGQGEKAQEHLNKALLLAQSKENYALQAKVLTEIGNLRSSEENYIEAIRYYKNSLTIASRLNAIHLLKNIYQQLAKFYDRLGDSDNSLAYFKLYMLQSEKLYEQENARKISETEALYNLEKKEKEIELLKKENEIQELRANEQELTNIGLLSGLLMVIVLVFVLYFAYRVKIKTNSILKQQKEAMGMQKEEIASQRDDIALKNKVLTEQNQLITDSIKYAQRIQQSLLPDTRSFKEVLPASFIFFKPKDIVSGDFYWFAEQDGKIILAVIDCTGHGVPGAFMTVLANSLLDQIVNESNITAPDMILSLLDHKIQHHLHQQDSDVIETDGLDIALVVFNKRSMILSYAGAKIPLYHSHHDQIQMVAPNRFSVGARSKSEREFHSHHIKMRSGDFFYLATDGFQDQFGGPHEKKFMKTRFRQLLQHILPMGVEDQYGELGKSFYHWKGNQSQTDDVLVIGVKIN